MQQALQTFERSNPHRIHVRHVKNEKTPKVLKGRMIAQADERTDRTVWERPNRQQSKAAAPSARYGRSGVDASMSVVSGSEPTLDRWWWW